MYMGVAKRFGLLEIMLAVYPILISYKFFGLPMHELWAIFMAVVAFLKSGKLYHNKILLIFIIYMIVHQILIALMLSNVPSYFYNNLITFMIPPICLFFIVPSLDYVKLRNSVLLVGIVCMIGMLYQATITISGGTVSPIKIPFMQDPGEESRFYEINNRPSSFFLEPSNYAIFMLVPLMMTLLEKQYAFAYLIVFFNFLSTSTNGIILSVVILVVYFIQERLSFGKLFSVLLFAAIIGYVVLDTDLFSLGVEKATTTELSENMRMANGLILVQGMDPWQLITGFIAPNALDFYYSSAYHGHELFMHEDFVDVYLPTFWRCLAQYGIVALILYCIFHIKLLKKRMFLLPFFVYLFISWFSVGSFVNGNFMFMICFIITAGDYYASLTNKTNFKKELN